MGTAPTHHESQGDLQQARIATTRRWCIYGILAWGLAAGLYFLLNALALALGNMISVPPSGPRSLPSFIWLRIALLTVPIIPLVFWFRISRRRESRIARHGAMTVALLGIAMHFGWVLFFVSMLGG